MTPVVGVKSAVGSARYAWEDGVYYRVVGKESDTAEAGEVVLRL